MPIKKSTFERPPSAPIFKPTLKEFDDPLTYIEKIRPIAQQYGICKIISPKQWNPPFAIDHNTFKFRPRVQRLNEVGAHSRIKSNFMKSIEAYWEYQNTPLVAPIFRGFQIDIFQLYDKVRLYGGAHQVTKNKQWTMVCREIGLGDKAKFVSSQVKSSYEKLIQPYLDFCDTKFMENNKELFQEEVTQTRTRGKTAMTVMISPKMTRSKTQKIKKQITTSCKVCDSSKKDESMVSCVECDLRFHINCLTPPLTDVISPWVCDRCLQINCARELARLDHEVFGFSQSTCKYSLDSFATYADNFKKTYFRDRENVSLKEVEEEYWRLVAAEDSNEDVVVKYGADISSGQTSSGFPTKANRHLFPDVDQKYVDSGWNLNNLPVLAKSIFRFVSNDISGMTVPWCYVGMVFSCFCWHIEDHWSYSINYMHTGECKTWYGVPESDADKFESVMRAEASDLFSKSPDLLHHITTQINPGTLTKNNVKVFRTDQAPGEFVVTFPRAYHAGFNQGFNFAEAVNFCPADWLAKGRASVESYRTVRRPSVFSHNELVCRMASSMECLDLVLLRAVYEEMTVIHQQEKTSRKTLHHQGSSCRTERLQLDEICEDDRECLYCRTTLYMSGVTCTTCCKDDRMMCLDHVSQVCSCVTKDHIVLKYRFSLDEISALVANVKNKLEQYNLWMTRLYHLAKSEFCASPVSVEESRVMKNVSLYIESLGLLQDGDLALKCIDEKPNLEELKMLLQLGRKMNCPELLLDFLEAIIDTCQRAMSMTDQLLKSHRVAVHEEDKENDASVKNEDNKSKKKTISKSISAYEDQSDKLSLSEMRMLVEKLRSLPAHVPQLEDAAQTLNSINEWRRRVKKVVSSNDVVDDGILQELIESGESNLVYLSEYQMLQKMRVHALWVTEARQLINCTDRSALPTLLQCKKVRDDGTGLINTVEIDRIATLSEALEVDEEDDGAVNGSNDNDDMSDYRRTGWNLVISNLKKYEKQLTETITNGEMMQKQSEDILKSTPGIFSLNALKTLLKGADNKLNCVVSGIERLKEVLKEALVINGSIAEMWQKLQLNRRLVHVNELQALIKQADSLCVSFDFLGDLKTINNNIELWKKNLHSLFIKASHNPHLTTPSLLEVLFPRPVRMFKLMIAREAVSSKLVMACKAESTLKKEETVKDEVDSCDDDKQSDEHKPFRNRASRKNRGRQKRMSFSADDPQVARKDNVTEFETFLKASSSTELDSFNPIYKNMCINELEWMWNLRELNEDKASKDSSGHDFYCFCRKRGIDQKGAQVMCDLCQDWFHLACLGIQNKDMSKKKFLCPQCERSKRPAFEVILAEKRKLEQEAKMLKIPEHMLLCLMSQRVISFHKHTNQLFSPQTELGAVFAEYKKLFGVQAILPKYQQQSCSVASQHELSPIHDQQCTSLDIPLSHLAPGKQSRKTPHSMFKTGLTPVNYPTPVTSVPVQLSPVPSKETLINIRRLRVSLSEDARRELEEIYIELCLLEVTQPTVTWIWKLYHSLIDDDDDDDEDEDDDNAPQPAVSGGEKYTVKKEHSTGQLSDSSDNSQPNIVSPCGDFMSKLHSKSAKRTKQLDNDPHENEYIKRECQPSSDDRRDAMEKFSFKRKLVAKNIVQPTTVKVKKQPVTVKSSRGVVTKKGRGRGGKRPSGYREIWEGNAGIASEYYDEENDVILLDNVEITKQSRRAKKTKHRSGSASDSKSLYTEDSGLITSGKHPSGTGRPQRLTSYHKQISTTTAADKSDYSDENSPSYDLKPANSLKRGRKSSTTTVNHEVVASTSVKKRKRTGTTSVSGGSGSKRVCNDDCAADECVQQSSDKVNWIACDICNLWYHWFCVGIKSDIEIDDRFLCPRCKDTKKQSRLPNYKDVLMSSLDDEVTEDLETDDLNVILDEQVSGDLVDMGSLTRIPSSTGSNNDPILHRTSSSQIDDQNTSNNEETYFRALASSSPQPPFLQPECCVQEEVVEISYVSRLDSD